MAPPQSLAHQALRCRDQLWLSSIACSLFSRCLSTLHRGANRLTGHLHHVAPACTGVVPCERLSSFLVPAQPVPGLFPSVEREREGTAVPLCWVAQIGSNRSTKCGSKSTMRFVMKPGCGRMVFPSSKCFGATCCESIANAGVLASVNN